MDFNRSYRGNLGGNSNTRIAIFKRIKSKLAFAYHSYNEVIQTSWSKNFNIKWKYDTLSENEKPKLFEYLNSLNFSLSFIEMNYVNRLFGSLA